MNPFQKLPPIPDGATGARGFSSAKDAKAAAQARAGGSYAILSAPVGVNLPGLMSLQLGAEYAWVAPAKVYTARAAQAMAAGIKVIELVDSK